ncbi:MAG: hypothetical protein ACPG8W_21895, partial [Candidatus Promineifilaceae bacterium]
NGMVSWGGNGMVSWGGNGMVSWGGNGMVSWGGNGMVSWGGNSLGIFNAPIASPDGQVVIFNTDNLLGYPAPSVLQTVNVPPDLPSWLTPVGEAMRYQTDRPVAETAVMQFSYLQRNLPTSAESQLAIYHYSAETWTPLTTTVDQDRNLAAAIMQGNGLYALMATVELPTFSTGWNHFGYPIEMSRVVSEALASIEDSYTMVYRFEPSATPQWSLYDATVRAPFNTLVNDLNELEFAKGYWIYATEAVTGYLPLNSRTQNVTLPPLTVYGFVTPNEQFAPEVGMIVEAKVGDVVCGRNEIVSIDGQLGYKLQIGAETVFGPSNGCGTNAAEVSLFVDGVHVAEGIGWAQPHSIQVNLPDYPSFSAVALVQQSAEMSPINIALLLMLLLLAVGTLQQWRNKNSFLG